MYVALVASLGVVAVMLGANETFARSGVAQQRGAFAATHGNFHSPGNRAFRHHRRNDGAIFWPGVDGDDYGPSGDGPLGGGPLGDGTPPSGNMHYTYTNDVPWDWVHRFPPMVARSDRPYVPTCPEETVTFPGRDGKDRTINVMRCY
jgi:hypothetical protein